MSGGGAQAKSRRGSAAHELSVVSLSPSVTIWTSCPSFSRKRMSTMAVASAWLLQLLAFSLMEGFDAPVARV